jgi:hypothetical protein
VGAQATIRRNAALLVAGAVALCACATGQAAERATPTPEPAPTQPPYQLRVQMAPQDARLGVDENVVVRAQFFTNQGRPIGGALMQAIVNYPTGPKTYTAEITTFPDGRLDLPIPVAPATRGSNVRVEVVMKYQGQEFRQVAGFTVR